MEHRHESEGRAQDSSIWVFAYGSLIWKVDFPYHEKVVGHVKGYARRFWQGSTDHRGVPGAPGRVVTLVRDQEEVTWGLAFRAERSLLSHLDHREKDGYSVHQVTFYPSDKDIPPFDLLVYIATESNESYLGPASLDDIANQVARSRGESGCNVEYALNLARTLREIFPHAHDPHLFGLEGKLKKILLDTSDRDNTQICNFCEYHSSTSNNSRLLEQK